MAQCKNYLLKIDRFYRFQTFDHIMFGYVQGLRKALPGIKIAQAIRLFLDSFQIDEDTYCFYTATQTYYRILNAIIESPEPGVKKVDDDTII